MQSSVAAILQSSNLFVYCGNDPVNRIDPSGLLWVVQGNDGMFRLEAFTNADSWTLGLASFTPIFGTGISNTPVPRITDMGTYMGSIFWRWFHTGGGSVFRENECTMARDLAVGGLIFVLDMATKNMASVTTFAWDAIVNSGPRIDYSVVIMGLMEVHDIPNSFYSLDDLLNQVEEFNDIIRNRPDYFFHSTSHGPLLGTLANSPFLGDLSQFRGMTEEQRLESPGLISRLRRET